MSARLLRHNTTTVSDVTDIESVQGSTTPTSSHLSSQRTLANTLCFTTSEAFLLRYRNAQAKDDRLRERNLALRPPIPRVSSTINRCADPDTAESPNGASRVASGPPVFYVRAIATTSTKLTEPHYAATCRRHRSI